MDSPTRSPNPHEAWRDAGPLGFTLLELLVAIAVLAALAVISFRGMGSILDAEVRVQSETRRWNDIAAVMAHMGRDLSLAAARPTRDGADRQLAAMVLGSSQGGLPDQLLVVRLGDEGGGTAQAGPRRIGYRLNGTTLEYLLWPAADVAPDGTPVPYAILENVVQMNWRALDQDGSWSATWPGARPIDALPRAIEAQFVLAGGERFSRLFLLR